jgi:Fe-S-cluster-containing dehydrogenase component
MARYGLIIDLSKCSGCYNCFLACRDEHYGNDYPPISLAQPFNGHFWMRIIERERGTHPWVKVSFIPKPCMHCDDPPCANGSATGAVYKRPDGIVIVDPEKSTGQKDIVSSCPYRVIFWNDEKMIPQKCTLCAHLLDQGWKEPRCVEACPTGTLVFGDLDDPKSEISRLWNSGKAVPLQSEFGIETRVKYMGIPKKFIAGTVLYREEDMCAEDVTVILTGTGTERTAKTDAFGDFEFEDLDDGDYVVSVEQAGYAPHTLRVRTRTDVYLGEIFLERAPATCGTIESGLTA